MISRCKIFWIQHRSTEVNSFGSAQYGVWWVGSLQCGIDARIAFSHVVDQDSLLHLETSLCTIFDGVWYVHDGYNEFRGQIGTL